MKPTFKSYTVMLLLCMLLILTACQPAPVSPAATQIARSTTPGTAMVSATATAPAMSIPAGLLVRGGTFIDGLSSDATGMNPILGSGGSASAAPTYQALQYGVKPLRSDPVTLELIPYAAKGYTISDDKLAITYRLRDDVLWSDGTKLTAADYTFAWEKRMDPKVNPGGSKSLQDTFESVSAQDDYTLIFRLRHPYVDALITSNKTPMPRHVFETVDFLNNPYNNAPTVGCGPFLLKEWHHDQYAEFVANDKFFLGRPLLDRYIVKIIPDPTVQYSQFKSGEVDNAFIEPQDLDEAGRLPNAQVLGYYALSGRNNHLGMNMRNPLLADRQVRQAIAAAINRDEMIKALRLGHGKPVETAFNPALPTYEPNVPRIPYNPEEAKRLLDAAGWKLNSSTNIREKDGQALQLSIYLPSGNKQTEKIAVIAQEQLRAVGIQVEIRIDEYNAWLKRLGTPPYDYTLFVFAPPGTEEPDGGTRNYWTTGAQFNFTGYSNPKVDQLYDEGRQTFDRAQQKAIFSTIQKTIAEEQPAVFLWMNESLVLVNNRIVLPYGSDTHIDLFSPPLEPWRWYSKTGK